jgi:Tfp pilus assembly protein PilO
VEKTPEEIGREIINKAWYIFNQQLNQALSWNNAKEEAIAEVYRMRERYAATAPNAPALEKQLKRFNELIATINEQIPTYATV